MTDNQTTEMNVASSLYRRWWIWLLAVILFSLIVNLGSLAGLNPWLAIGITLLTIFILPGVLVLMITGTLRPTVQAEILPAAFVLGLGLLSPFSLLGVGLQWSLFTLAYISAILNVGLVSILLSRHRHARAADTPTPLNASLPSASTNPILVALTVLVVVGCLTLFLTTMTTWTSGDLWYLRYIRHYIASDYAYEVFNLRASWWALQAWQDKAAGLEPLAAFSFYLPPFLMIISVLAFYSLARELFERTNPALLATLLHLLYLLSTIGSHDWLGRGFFDRIQEDKLLVWLIILPVALMFALRYLKTGRKRLLWGLGLSYIALVLVHPIGMAQGGISVGGLGLVHLLVHRKRETLLRVVIMGGLLGLLVAVPLIQRSTIWGLQPGEDIRESRAFNYALATGVAPHLPALNQTRLWVFSALDDNYVAHPHLITHPLILLAILLTPLLLFNVQRSITAQFLLGTMMMPLLVLYTPLVTPLLGQIITPWMVYRISWSLPVALVLAYWLQPLPDIAAAWLDRLHLFKQYSEARLTLLPVVVILLLAFTLSGYIADGLAFLHSRQEQTIPNSAQDMLENLKDHLHSPNRIIVPLPIRPEFVQAYQSLPPQGVLTMNSRDSSITEAVARFYRTRLITEDVLNLLTQWQVDYVILERSHLLTDQLDQLPDHFRRVYQNDGYTLYQVLSPPAANPIIRANTRLLQDKLDTARNGYRAALASGTGLPLAYFGRGELLRRQDRLIEAEAAYRQALAAAPTFRPAALALAGLLVENNDFTGAATVLSRLLNHHPTDPTILQKLGKLYLQQGNVDLALAYFRQRITAPPETGAYHLALGQLLHQNGMTDAVITEYQQVIATDQIPEGWLYPGLILGTRNTLIHPVRDRLRQAYLGLGEIYENQGKIEAAEAAYRQAIKVTPDRPEGYLALNRLYRQTNRAEKAVRTLNRASRAVVNAAWPHLELGKIYLQKSQSTPRN